MNWIIDLMFRKAMSWACSMGKCDECDGTSSGPGSGNCQHFCHGH